MFYNYGDYSISLDFQGFLEYPEDPFLNDVIFYSRFDGDDGAITADDESSNNLQIEFNGGASISTSQAKLGSSSCVFNSSNLSYLKIPHSFNFSGDFTVEAWVFLNYFLSGSINYKNVICELGENQVLAFGSSSNTLRFSNFIISTYSPSLSEWHHISLTRKSGELKLFADGMEVATTNNNSDFSTNEIYIGRHRTASTDTRRYYEGYIDNFRVTSEGRYTTTFNPNTDTFL